MCKRSATGGDAHRGSALIGPAARSRRTTTMRP